MDPLFPVAPENFAELDDAALASFIEESEGAFESIRADSAAYVTEERTTADLVAEMQVAADALRTAREELASRETVEETEEEPADVSAVETLAAEALAASEAEPEEEPEAEPDEGDGDEEPEPEAEATAAVEETAVAVVASPLPRPARARRSAPVPATPKIALTASAPNLGPEIGEEIDKVALAEMMQRRRRDFGRISEGTHGEKIPLAKMDWTEMYGPERTLDMDPVSNQAKIAALLDESVMRAELERRKAGALTAAGGLCAPVTPYYDLQMISVADRPVKAALPSFNAVRGGISAAAPASLASITTAVGAVTADEDYLGGTYATKSCQVIDCPAFHECDVEAIYHCIQFGNLPARTFPELLAQWTDLVLAAHARLAESILLTAISAGSTQVTVANAGGLGYGATILSQILEAAAGMRSRHRMADDAPLRVLLPSYILDALVSDTFRTQFGRFEMTQADFLALIRAANVEPSFYKDTAAGHGQVWGAQAAGALTSFPAVAVWYLFPEGTWLFLDGGTLELGLVRDSVLNSTNDFQIFGETFEGICNVGVESLEVVSTVCDSGGVTAPQDVNCPVT